MCKAQDRPVIQMISFWPPKQSFILIFLLDIGLESPTSEMYSCDCLQFIAWRHFRIDLTLTTGPFSCSSESSRISFNLPLFACFPLFTRTFTYPYIKCWAYYYMRPKRGPPLRSQGHCFSRPQVTRSLFFMRKLKQHRSQVVFLNCRGRTVALKMAPGRRSRKPPLGPPTWVCRLLFIIVLQ